MPQIDSFSDEGLRPTSVTGEVEVKDVVFAYPASPDHPICNGYSLSIAAGQTAALCGPSGSGKSTVINLIDRYLEKESVLHSFMCSVSSLSESMSEGGEVEVGRHVTRIRKRFTQA